MKNNSAQETLINMLQCFKNPIHSLKGKHGFNKFNMKDSELESEDNHMPELYTAPHFLRAKHTYSRLNKTTAWMNDKKRDPQNNDFQGFFINAIEEPEHKTVYDGHNNSSEVQTAQDKEAYPVEESEPSQSSLDSNSTSTSFNTGSSVENESSCSVCEDGNEDGSPGSNILYTPPTGILLRDPMLGAFPTAWKKRFSIRPKLPETPVRKADTLILSPSLLTSPSQGLKHYLLPEGQETLQTLFEDVWVTPESTIFKGPRLSCRVANESTMISAGRACVSSRKKKGNKSSEDENSTPEKDVLLKKERKACAHRHTGRRPKAQTQAPSSKKKCVNGFIMFCRMNRKVYIRSHPGTPSTTVTKELANLWHVMPKQERRLYCLKAWRFSCQNNRNVRAVAHEPETEADDPSPLHRLLAHRDLYCDTKRRSSHFI